MRHFQNSRFCKKEEKKSKGKDPTGSPVEHSPFFHTTAATDASLLSKYFPQSFFFLTAAAAVASFQLTHSLQLCSADRPDRKLHLSAVAERCEEYLRLIT